jgi:ribonucleoside-diphosphate reductase alpha chain
LISVTTRKSGGRVVKQLPGISCHLPSGFGENRILSCADAAAKAILSLMAAKGCDAEMETPVHARGACVECGGMVDYEGG